MFPADIISKRNDQGDTVGRYTNASFQLSLHEGNNRSALRYIERFHAFAWSMEQPINGTDCRITFNKLESDFLEDYCERNSIRLAVFRKLGAGNPDSYVAEMYPMRWRSNYDVLLNRPLGWTCVDILNENNHFVNIRLDESLLYNILVRQVAPTKQTYSRLVVAAPQRQMIVPTQTYSRLVVVPSQQHHAEIHPRLIVVPSQRQMIVPVQIHPRLVVVPPRRHPTQTYQGLW